MQSSSSDYCVSHYNIRILNLCDPELQLINAKPVIKSKLKYLLDELKFKVQTILVLEYTKIDDHKSMGNIFHLSA